MKIGLLSDTHGYLDPSIFEYFNECDELWHAGDIGTIAVIQQLRSFKPTKFVYGNIDSSKIQQETAENLWLQREGCLILMTHIGGRPGRYDRRIAPLTLDKKPTIFVCGHSHILNVSYDKAKNWLYLNPGACGKQGFHKTKTVIRFEITDSKPKNLEVIELGSR